MKYSLDIYLFKIKYGNNRKRREICSILPIKTQQRGQWRPSVVFNVNFGQISNIVLVFPLTWPSKFRLRDKRIDRSSKSKTKTLVKRPW